MKLKPLVIIGLSLVGIIASMTTLKFEVVTPGTGVIAGGAGDIDIVTPDSGFINILNVKVGDKIEKGDVIFSYNNLDVYYRNESLGNMMTFLEEKRTSLQADIENMRILYESASRFNYEAVSEFQPKFGTNAERYLKEFNSISRKALELKLTESMNKAERKELEYQKDLITKKIKLLEDSRSPKIELLENQREVAQLTASMIDLDSKLLSMQVELKNEIDAFQIGVLEKNNALQDELSQIERELLEAKDALALTLGRQKANVIVSPVSGSILNIEKQFTVGSYIEASQKVLTIKQSQSDSLIKAKIESQYRPFINVGANARIAISSPGYKQSLTGEIRSISVDSFLDENNPSSNARFYEVEVVAENAHSINSDMIGVQASIYVVSDNITVFEYITATIVENIYFGVW